MNNNLGECPLNINLIIPFKDNIGDKQRLHQRRLNDFKDELEFRVDELRSSLPVLFGEDFELAIMARGEAGTKRYYWRFRSNKRDRKYNRLDDAEVTDYIRNFHDSLRLRLGEIEEELIYINANMKVLNTFRDALNKSKKEILSVKLIQY